MIASEVTRRSIREAVRAVEQQVDDLSRPMRARYPESMRVVELSDGTELHMLDKGDGMPVVLLHGWGSSSELWRYQIDSLTRRFRTIAPDLRGFGLSSRADGRLTLDIVTSDVAELLERLSLERVCLMGWSMGGLVVMRYCEAFDMRPIAGIGIMDVAPRLLPAPDWELGVGMSTEIGSSRDRWERTWARDPQAVLGEITTMAFADYDGHRADIEWLTAESQRADPLAMELLSDLYACDFRPMLPRVGVPSLLLYGRLSTSTTPAVADYIRRAILKSQLVMFEHSGHALMIEEPTKFNEVVCLFVERL
jgi:pimeloyl-ACP methyl ester carboxylesterase